MLPVSRVERRHRFRVQTEIPVTWAWAERLGAPVPGTVLDISSAGARLISAECPQVGEVISITLSVAEPELELVTLARVVRIADLSQPVHRIWAVSFEELDLDQQARLARFVFCEAARRSHVSPVDRDAVDRSYLEPREQQVAHLGEERTARKGRGPARHGWYS
jgi:c-di-GMP-binding flagellar brake protein YcgR